MKKKFICVVAGRSGGHIIPGMTYIENFTALHPECSALFISTDSSLDASIIERYRHTFSSISLAFDGLPGRKIWLYPLFFFQFMRAFLQSFSALRRKRPVKVVSMGGYISIPVCLAARVLAIPYELFELNAVPGRAVLWLARGARKLYVCFNQARAYFEPAKVEFADYPIRFGYTDRVTQSEALRQFGFEKTKKTLLVLGGSQGSRSINELVKNFFRARAGESELTQVIHQAGFGNVRELESFYKQEGVDACVFDYLHELNYAYDAADYVICRAGAGTVFELEFFEKKALLVPLELPTTAHQVNNAQAMVYKNPDLFTMMRQSEYERDPERCYQLIFFALKQNIKIPIREKRRASRL